MASKATGAIITIIVVLAVVVAVVLFLGKGKASASSAGAGASGGGATPPSGGLGALAQAIANSVPPLKSLGVIPPSNAGLPPPAGPDGVGCESDGAPAFTPPPRPTPVFNTVEEMEHYTVRGAGSF